MEDPMQGLVPDPVKEIVVPEPKSKKSETKAELEILDDGSLKELEVPTEQKKEQDAPVSDVLDGLLTGSKLEEASLANEMQRSQIADQMLQLEKLERIESQKEAGSEALESQWASREEAFKAVEGPLAVETRSTKALEPLRVMEAALFLANKPLTYKQLQDILQVPQARIKELLGQLSLHIPSESVVELTLTEHAAAMQVKPEYLERVSHLSKEVELSRKSMRILALIAKKKQLLQSDLKHFFKGEIYAYVSELKNAGYVDSKKRGNTRLLTPSTKFFDSFQFKE